MFAKENLYFKESLLCRNDVVSCHLFIFPSPVETVLHKAGSGADQGDGHRLRDESHLRHVCETWKQSGGLQHAVSPETIYQPPFAA